MELHVFAHGNKIVINRMASAQNKAVGETGQSARAVLVRLQ